MNRQIAKSQQTMSPSISFSESSPRSEVSANRMVKWLQECEQHEECATTEAQCLPSRVIDIGKECPFVRLHVSCPGELGTYTALSYCWGGYDGIKLTTSELVSFQEGIEEGILPQTYKDAIFVTRNLGIRYLWIDALTVLQDNESDWQSECEKMDQVYGNARLTLSASNAASAEEGFLGDRERRDTALAYCGLISHEQVRYPMYLTEQFHGFGTRASREDLNSSHSGQLRREPLTSRGWAVQEILLSKRILYFSSDRMIWQCRHVTCTEDGITSKPQLSLQPPTTTNTMDSGRQCHWQDIVESHSNCRLSKPSDRLPALSGVARAFGEYTRDSYVYGHWKESLVRSLMWTKHSGYRNPHGLAPSWSWASMSSGVVLFRSPQESSIDHDVAGIVEEKTLASGMVNIFAPTAVATLHVYDSDSSSLEFDNVLYIDLNVQVDADLDDGA